MFQKHLIFIVSEIHCMRSEVLDHKKGSWQTQKSNNGFMPVVTAKDEIGNDTIYRKLLT